jgi:hypothetical protein
MIEIRQLHEYDVVNEEVVCLLLRSKTDYFPVGTGNVLDVIRRAIQSGYVLIAFKENKPVALSFSIGSGNPFPARVIHFYSEDRKATQALKIGTLSFLSHKGYNQVAARNGSGMPNKVWERVFRTPGWKLVWSDWLQEYRFERI